MPNYGPKSYFLLLLLISFLACQLLLLFTNFKSSDAPSSLLFSGWNEDNLPRPLNRPPPSVPWRSTFAWLEDALIQNLSHPWKSTNGNYSWCVPSQSERSNPIAGAAASATAAEKTTGTPTIQGLVFVKVPKAASSTAAGVNLRIAHAVGERIWKRRGMTSCSFTYDHGHAWRQRTAPYLLWSTVREPLQRGLSEFFHFEVARKQRPPTSKNMIRHLSSTISYQMAYLAVQQFSYQADYVDVIRAIMTHYSFLVVVERWHESMVVMKLLWGLQDSDVIVLSAKQFGGWDDGRWRNQCFQVPESFTTPEVDIYVQQKYRTKENFDYLLYAVANRSLDMTIDWLGRERVEQEVVEHVQLQRLAENACLAKTNFPCNKQGKPIPEIAAKNCRLYDSDCGYRCVENNIYLKNSFTAV